MTDRRTAVADGVRRLVDVTVACAGLVVTAPMAAAAALGIRVTMGSGVLFRQQRSGRDAVPFTMLKLRTMRHATPETSGVEHDAERLTRLGRLLRSTSVDEIPSLVNLLRGDITLVGPRPLPVHYLARYTPTQRRRLEVRPGITGLAVVAGRNDITWARRLELDVQYVDTRSLRGDAMILARTAPLVFARRGITQPNAATMEELPDQR